MTSNLTALECRHLSSDDEIISTDDVDSTYDTADDFDDNEGYAMTFDHPGRLRSSFRWSLYPKQH